VPAAARQVQEARVARDAAAARLGALDHAGGPGARAARVPRGAQAARRPRAEPAVGVVDRSRDVAHHRRRPHRLCARPGRRRAVLPQLGAVLEPSYVTWALASAMRTVADKRNGLCRRMAGKLARAFGDVAPDADTAAYIELALGEGAPDSGWPTSPLKRGRA